MTDELFQRYATFIGQNFGIQLPKEKKILLETRLLRLFDSGQTKSRDAETFFREVTSAQRGRARALLADAITTNHTFFMRENDHFSYLAQQVLPYWSSHIRDGDLRTWCAACSSGEEAYTLAMLIEEHFSKVRGAWDTTLLATDLSPEILSEAKAGIYDEDAIASLPVSCQKLYFTACGKGEKQVVPRLKQKILFRRFNLMNVEFPFRRAFHIIFCRNVMIYFDLPTRQGLVRRFYDFLEPGGYLFIGHAETIDRQSVPFDYVRPSVYRRPL